jgi:hypothetical protein
MAPDELTPSEAELALALADGGSGWFPLSQMDVPARQAYLAALAGPRERSTAADDECRANRGPSVQRAPRRSGNGLGGAGSADLPGGA